jgi:hypothetical protein
MRAVEVTEWHAIQSLIEELVGLAPDEKIRRLAKAKHPKHIAERAAALLKASRREGVLDMATPSMQHEAKARGCNGRISIRGRGRWSANRKSDDSRRIDQQLHRREPEIQYRLYFDSGVDCAATFSGPKVRLANTRRT